jgi:hypothetical protein
MALLRHAALKRHVRMDADPLAVRLPRQHNSGPAWPVKSGTFRVESRARPRRDDDGHGSVGAGKHRGVVQIKSKILGARPDIGPLGIGPGGEPAHQFLMCAKNNDVRMPERSGGSEIDFAHAGGEASEPIVDRGGNVSIGIGNVHDARSDGQGEIPSKIPSNFAIFVAEMLR